MQVSLLIVFAIAFAASAVQYYEAPIEMRIAHSYILQFVQNMTDDSVKAYVNKLKASAGVVVHYEYNIGPEFRGVAAFMSAEAKQARLLEDHAVLSIEEDRVVTMHQCQSQTVEHAAWNLQRVSATNPSNTNTPYKYNQRGAGVTAYIIDTGIRITHEEFAGGRATWGYAFDGTSSDCNGHGTHVAGTVGGAYYGIAKGVSLVAVKVLNCQGSGSLAGIIGGVDYVTQQHRSRGTASNANMSLGGGNMPTLCQAISASISAGVVYVTAAGNSNADACTTSPANCAGVINVGASSLNSFTTRTGDTRASFSNWGSCLHVFAPGQNIPSAWNTSNSAYNTISGTSMAAPHIAGYVSLLQSASPSITPAAARTQVINNAATGKISMGCSGACGQSPNRLLHSTC